MNPEAPSDALPQRRHIFARVVAVGALVAAVAFVVVMFFGDDGGRQYKLLFETGGQLVRGNEVLVAGQKVGTIDALDLTEDGQAEVSVTMDRPITEGTTAQIRATSLSGIANRYISLQMGPTDDEIEDGATVSADSTTSPVDIDQLFSIFDDKTRKSLQDVFKGQAAIYAGDPELSRETYKYLAPSLQSTERFLAELTRDQDVLAQFLASGSNVLGAIAERRSDLSSLTQNANSALSAIAAESASLDDALAVLPPTMRQANTTFVNLRVALDDVDKLVQTSYPATENLAPFLRDLRPVAEKAVPVVNDLRGTVAVPGPNNDLTDALFALPELENQAADTSSQGIEAMDVSEENLAVTRAYSPDIMALVSRLGQITGYYSADGHYARSMPTTNIFSYDNLTDQLNPIYNNPDQQYDFYATPRPAFPNPFSSFGFQRCPGTASQPAQDGSTPFVEDEVTGNCDESAVVPEQSATLP
ncbi:MAG: phospholipid/cholesterol/gamma-HCH transport system substrate-binding protein [Solirubrobacterales bacterium]|nr:phospholipid/cholesterol/gamma-HCH transport system substrate-binding protein [Solirubrobacterales bacterium]